MSQVQTVQWVLGQTLPLKNVKLVPLVVPHVLPQLLLVPAAHQVIIYTATLALKLVHWHFIETMMVMFVALVPLLATLAFLPLTVLSVTLVSIVHLETFA